MIHRQEYRQSQRSTTTQGKTAMDIISPRLSHREGELHGAMPTARLGAFYDFGYAKIFIMEKHTANM